MPRKLLIAAGVLASMTIAAAAYGERAWDCRTQALRGDIAAARMPCIPQPCGSSAFGLTGLGETEAY